MLGEGRPVSLLSGDPIFKPIHQRPVKLTLDLPAFTAPRTLSTCKRRKRVSPQIFVRDVIKNADVSDVFRQSTCDEVTAKNKNAIHRVIKKVLGAPSVYFDKTELSIILHMYLQLTGLKMREISNEEMKGFLYSTLGITNLFSLDGICRASTKMNNGPLSTTKRYISPSAFVRTLSIMLRGTIDDRAELAFYAMDIDSDGFLRKTVEIRRLLQDSFDTSISAQNAEIDPDEPARDTANFLCEKLNCTITSHVSVQEFREKCQRHPWIVECLLPCIPAERVNYIFQSLFTTGVNIPSIESAVEPTRPTIKCVSGRKSTYSVIK
ncbi:EF-hand calcium-binding domain-containing protein [Echinococcus granulosus]|uniref:EF-hand calcium-binding domain-containing protein n=1 Tax=Echinococcus granulosus TaxID=6210 RepID=W6UPG0_ECHGR|nr:EF-hand calcium-binding domain-containing protein [Echinococcus granulosus]EUB60162.1 EF-hand calcium-binding domain-containing protein [Echinococcus granulosus]